MRGEVTDSEFERQADEEEERVDREVDRLMAKPLALARVEKALGPTWARRQGQKWGLGGAPAPAPGPAPAPKPGGGSLPTHSKGGPARLSWRQRSDKEASSPSLGATIKRSA